MSQIDPLKDKATFASKGTSKGSSWVGSVGLLAAIFGGCFWINDSQVDEPMIHDKWVYVLVILLGIGLMYCNTRWRQISVQFSPMSGTGPTSSPCLKVKVVGRKGMEAAVLPESLQYWYWVYARKRDGDNLRTFNCIVLLETIDHSKIGFSHQFLDNYSIPNHWKRIDEEAPKGIPIFMVNDIVLLVDYLRGYAGNP